MGHKYLTCVSLVRYIIIIIIKNEKIILCENAAGALYIVNMANMVTITVHLISYNIVIIIIIIPGTMFMVLLS